MFKFAGMGPHLGRGLQDAHNGVDFLTPTGTELLAVHDGTVLQAELNDPSGLGNFILLRHSWGESIYAHMQAHDVRQGQEVRRGQRIGWSNDSGFSNGPHLHFAIRIHPYTRADGWGGYSDPLPYMNPADVQLPAYVLASLPRAFSVLPEASAPTQEAAAMPAQNRATGIGLAPDQAGLRRP